MILIYVCQAVVIQSKLNKTEPILLRTTWAQILHPWLSCVDIFISSTINEFVLMPIWIKNDPYI